MNKLLFRRLMTSIGLRREEKNVWEARSALCPEHVGRLIKEDNIDVFIQPSGTRIYTDAQYRKAGAQIKEDLSECNLIIGVKEIPISQILSKKQHLCFSHTHKGQPQNAAILRAYMNKKATLFDYELLRGDRGRLVAFGKWAGYAGIIDCLHGVGLGLLEGGIRTPLVNIAMAHTYASVDAAKLALKEVGKQISTKGTGKPVLIIITGTGKVAKGAQEMLSAFGSNSLKWLNPSEISEINQMDSINDTLYSLIYGSLVPSEYYLGPAKNGNGEVCNFSTKFAPFATAIVNGAYWESHMPRLLKNVDIERIGNDPKSSLKCIADISLDLKGSIEATDRVSTFKDPFLFYSPKNGKSIRILAIDNLPAEFPKESSEYFGDCLLPLLKEYISNPTTSKIMRESCIVKNGELTPEHQKTLKSMIFERKRILVLGSGFVAGPVIEYLGDRDDFDISIASNNPAEMMELALLSRNQPETIELNINHGDRQLEKEISKSNIVISLLPAKMHPAIAKYCLQHGKHLVTASYISPEMQKMSSEASSKNLIFLNECGLDPGLDHLSARHLIDRLRGEGEKIVEFESFCGGLPAPESLKIGDPLKYKFSWSPLGVLLATKNAAEFLKGGKIVKISGNDLLRNTIESPLGSTHPLNLEGIPNRNSLTYVQKYNLNGDMKVMLRGTLRYKGFSDVMTDFANIGLLDDKRELSVDKWTMALDILMKDNKILINSQPKAWEFLQSLELNQQSFDPNISIIQNFSNLLHTSLPYAPNERDMVILEHKVKTASGKIIKSSLIQFADTKFTAMARTVGYPVALATEMILDGRCEGLKGVLDPTDKTLYDPLLSFLSTKFGIQFTEKIVSNS